MTTTTQTSLAMKEPKTDETKRSSPTTTTKVLSLDHHDTDHGPTKSLLLLLRLLFVPPSIGLLQGMQRKDSVLKLESWVKLSLTLDGRDKITKLFQYISRFLAWWWMNKKNQAKRFAALKTTLTNSRKAFRLGRTLIEFHKLRAMFEEAVAAATNRTCCWKMVFSAGKTLGLAGFWAGDNVNFLTGTGFLDDWSVETEQRLQSRQRLQTRASHFANRFYFFGALSGLVVSLKSYLDFRHTHIRKLQDNLDNSSNTTEIQAIQKELDQAREKQFVLFLALLKSCCDVLVFSNNPGIDLWEKYRGKKLNEGVHCVGGILSASTVLYNNFPDRKLGK